MDTKQKSNVRYHKVSKPGFVFGARLGIHNFASGFTSLEIQNTVAFERIQQKKKCFLNLLMVSKQLNHVDFEMLKLKIISWDLFELTLQNDAENLELMGVDFFGLFCRVNLKRSQLMIFSFNISISAQIATVAIYTG